MSIRRAITISLLTILPVTVAASTALSQASGSTPVASATAEDLNTTGTAKAFYDELLLGKVDRSKMSAELNTALPDSTVKTLAQQLGALGSPKWQYLKQIRSEMGNVQVYKLSYTSATLYLTFGVSQGGTIFSLFFGSQDPAR